MPAKTAEADIKNQRLTERSCTLGETNTLKRISVLIATIAFCIFALPSMLVQGQSQEPTGKFRRVKNPIPDQYIVVLNDKIPGSDVASIADALTRVHGKSPKFVYHYALNGFSVHDLPEAAAIALSQDPSVEFVEQNGIGSVADMQTITYPGGPWHLDRIDQTDIGPGGSLSGTYTYNQTGSGVNAYVLDTGVRTTHQELGGRAFFGADFIGGDTRGGNGDCFDPENTGQSQGHGTPAAGVLGSNTYGVAKGVTMYSVRVCDCSGQCLADTIIQGVDWVTGQHVKPAVTNMSIYLRGGSNALDKAVKKSIEAGVIYAVAAGNGDQNNVGEDAGTVSPARVTQAITVGATGDNTSAQFISDVRPTFSNFGSVLDLFAPGVNTPSIAASSDTLTFPNFGGTSSSSPQVAGAAAMYLQTNSTACPCTVSKVISDNATPNKIPNPGTGSSNKVLFIPQTWPVPTYYSLSLNGTTSYVQVPTDSGAVGLNITGYITVEAWIKLNFTGTAQAIIERYGATGTDGGYALTITSNGKVKFWTLTNASTFDSVTGNTALQPGVWYHVAGVWGGLTMRVFVNGMLDSPLKSSTFAPGTGVSPLFIGRSAVGGAYFNGLIDEARVTADALYLNNFTPQHRVTGVIGTKALWRFDDQTAKDCGGFNDGSPVGGVSFSTDVP